MWRYIGNGGGMGIAFALIINSLYIKSEIIWIGLLYAIMIFSSLLLVPADEQSMMFKITPFTFAGSLIGHVIYGLVLGWMERKN